MTPEGLHTLWSTPLPEAPTALEWLTDSRFVSGLAGTNTLGVFDAEKGGQLWDYEWEPKGPCGQVNRVRVSRQMIVAGHEDNSIRFFDPNSSNSREMQTGR